MLYKINGYINGNQILDEEDLKYKLIEFCKKNGMYWVGSIEEDKEYYNIENELEEK